MMNAMLITVKILALFVFLWFFPLMIMRAKAKQDIPSLIFIVTSASATIFIILQFGLYK